MLRHVPVKSLATQAQPKVLNLTTRKPPDFFGIRDITSKDIAGAFRSFDSLPKETKQEKYDMLKNKRYVPTNWEVGQNLVFAYMRRDSDNVPKFHGQYEPSNIEPKFSSVDVKEKYMPEHDQPTPSQVIVGGTVRVEEKDPQYEPSNIALGNPPYKISEVEPVEPISTALNLLKTERPPIAIAADYKNCAPVIFNFESAQPVLLPQLAQELEQTDAKAPVRYSRAPIVVAGRKVPLSLLESRVTNRSDEKCDQKSEAVEPDIEPSWSVTDVEANDERITLHEEAPKASDERPRSVETITKPITSSSAEREETLETVSTEQKNRSVKTVIPSAPTKLSGHKIEAQELESAIEEALNMVDDKPTLTYDPKIGKTPLNELEPDSEEYMERFFENEKSEKFDEMLHLEETAKPDTKKASDYLKEIRAKRVEPTAKGLKHRLEKPEVHYPLTPIVRLDSKGYSNYANQVPNWFACRREQILDYVKKSIIYHNYDILAINKPYGIASHEKVGEKEPFDMNGLVHDLAKELRLNAVHLAHRLDKNTTGVLLFATSPERAKSLHKLFRSDQITKTYWCITSRVPNPTEGIIDIPIGQFKCAGKLRSCPVVNSDDQNKQVARRFREARRAITEYRVLNVNKQAALVEVRPRTGVKHQIRCHMAYGIEAPILGDHKYSHMDRVAPQTLSIPLLKLLHLRQQKVRTLPLHLHAKRIVIPNAKANGETLFIEAPLPAHFAQNMKFLRLKHDENSR